MFVSVCQELLLPLLEVREGVQLSLTEEQEEEIVSHIDGVISWMFSRYIHIQVYHNMYMYITVNTGC